MNSAWGIDSDQDVGSLPQLLVPFRRRTEDGKQ